MAPGEVTDMTGEAGAEAPAWRSLWAGVRGDACLYHALRFPGRRATPWSWARLVLASPGLWVLAAYRADRSHQRWAPATAAGRLLRGAVHLAVDVVFRLCHVITKSDVVPSSGALEPGVYLSDAGHVNLGVRALGAGSLVHHHVTIGRGLRGWEKPAIGRDVWIGPRCVLYGQIRIGDGATILPGTVVTRSVPARAVLEGNPAVVVRREFDNAPLRRTLASDEASVRRALEGGA